MDEQPKQDDSQPISWPEALEHETQVNAELEQEIAEGVAAESARMLGGMGAIYFKDGRIWMENIAFDGVEMTVIADDYITISTPINGKAEVAITMFPQIAQIDTPFTAECPHCDTVNAPYGYVVDPPIGLQMADNNFGVERDWLAARHRCAGCGELYDRVIINKITNR